MIQIHEDQIRNWEKIKNEHIEFVEKVIRKKLNSITKKSAKITLDKSEIEFIEKIFNCKYENGKFTIIDNTKIKLIAVGKIEDISKLFEEFELDEKKKEVLKYIIAYSEIYEDNYRDKLITKMDILVCPYCNINLIMSYEDEGKTKNTGQVDHFYMKSEYPQYGLSIYNFIPSCATCNTKLKGQSDSDESLYPYEEGYEKYGTKFEVIPTGSVVKQELKIDDLTEENFRIEVDTDNNKVKKTVKMLKTNEIYSSKKSKEKVLEVKNKMKKYSKENVEKINEIIGKKVSYKEFILDSSYCKNESDMLNREFSKLKNDVFEKYCDEDILFMKNR